MAVDIIARGMAANAGSGGGSSSDTKIEIALSGDSGVLTAQQISKLIDDKINTVITNEEEVYYLSVKSSTPSYREYINSKTTSDSAINYKRIHVNTDSTDEEYGAWNLEAISPSSGGIVFNIGSYQYAHEGYILPAIDVDDARLIYENDKLGIPQVLVWNIYGNESQFKIVSSDEIAGNYSFDILVHNKYHCAYTWNDETNGLLNPQVMPSVMYIPDGIFNLEESSTEQEILEAFGGEDKFNQIHEWLSNGNIFVVRNSREDRYGLYRETYPCYVSYQRFEDGFEIIGFYELFQNAARDIWFNIEEGSLVFADKGRYSFALEEDMTEYVDDELKNFTGFNRSKTQILKNVNGTLTWIDE